MINSYFLKKVSSVLLFTIVSFNALCGKNVKIKLTGTVYEEVEVTVGSTGRNLTLTSLPFELEVDKKELPLTLSFKSPSYLYYSIDVPKKPFDTTGHIYLLKINESAMALRNSNNSSNVVVVSQPVVSETAEKPVQKGLDFSKKINCAPETNNINDNTFALIISNEDYEMAANVENATNDGLAFKEYCERTIGIPAQNLRHFSNLSFGKMRKAFSDMLELVDMLKGEGNLIIYYAGHGIPDNSTKDAFLMPVDADGTDTGVCLSLSELYKSIDSKTLNRCVVFLDACFSGAQRGGDMVVAARGVKLKPKEATPGGRTIVFSATSDDEAAFSHKEEGHGLFTYYLLLKLQESNGNVKLGELAEYLQQKVGFESRRINNKPQTPRVAVSQGIVDAWKSISLTK